MYNEQSDNTNILLLILLVILNVVQSAFIVSATLVALTKYQTLHNCLPSDDTLRNCYLEQIGDEGLN